MQYNLNRWYVVQSISSTHAIRSRKRISYKKILLAYNNENFVLMKSIAEEAIRRSNIFFELVRLFILEKALTLIYNNLNW
jgi:hypothetical protein